MDKQVLTAVVGDNEPKSLARIKPFYCTCTHFYFSLARKKAN
jgi:hypothetical protein